MTLRRQPMFGEEGEDNNYNYVKKFGLLFLFRRYAEVSSVSGIPQLQRSKETIRIMIWTLIVLAGTGVLCWQSYIAIAKYLNYDISTSLSRKTNASLNFPAVTICNANNIDYTKISQVSNDIYLLLKSWDSSKNSGNQSNQGSTQNSNTSQSTGTTQPNSAVSGSNQMPNINGFGGRTADVSFQRKLLIQSKIANLSLSQRISVGHKLEDMLINCYYNNYLCNTSDFVQFYNLQYGNCYTFNMLNNKNALQSLEIGPQYGLRMVLFISSAAYIPTTENSGIRLLIHNPSEYPFPEDVGILASPGKLTSVGLSLTLGSIYTPPYGECALLNYSQQLGLSVYMGLLPNMSYTKEGCMKTCLQKYILLICKCYHPGIPYNSTMSAYQNISSSNVRLCDITDQTSDAVCFANTKVGIMNKSLDCSNCTLDCTKYSYRSTVSQCNWPSDIILQSIVTKLSGIPGMTTLQNNGVPYATIISNQILSIEIYYDSLTYIDMSDSPAYIFFSLLSDLGGQMGLWLGLSISAFFEIFELMYDTFVAIIQVISMKYVERRSKRKQYPKIKKKIAWDKF